MFISYHSYPRTRIRIAIHHGATTMYVCMYYFLFCKTADPNFRRFLGSQVIRTHTSTFQYLVCLLQGVSAKKNFILSLQKAELERGVQREKLAGIDGERVLLVVQPIPTCSCLSRRSLVGAERAWRAQHYYYDPLR